MQHMAAPPSDSDRYSMKCDARMSQENHAIAEPGDLSPIDEAGTNAFAAFRTIVTILHQSARHASMGSLVQALRRARRTSSLEIAYPEA